MRFFVVISLIALALALPARAAAPADPTAGLGKPQKTKLEQTGKYVWYCKYWFRLSQNYYIKKCTLVGMRTP